MKIHKLEKIKEGDNIVIRVTYTNWWSTKKKKRDVIKSCGGLIWVWYDNPSMVKAPVGYDRTFDVFHENDLDERDF